jgi:hypothetical protein
VCHPCANLQRPLTVRVAGLNFLITSGDQRDLIRRCSSTRDGSPHARTSLSSGGEPARDDLIVQERNVGLISIRRGDEGHPFATPPLIHSGSSRANSST